MPVFVAEVLALFGSTVELDLLRNVNCEKTVLLASKPPAKITLQRLRRGRIDYARAFRRLAVAASITHLLRLMLLSLYKNSSVIL